MEESRPSPLELWREFLLLRNWEEICAMESRFTVKRWYVTNGVQLRILLFVSNPKCHAVISPEHNPHDRVDVKFEVYRIWDLAVGEMKIQEAADAKHGWKLKPEPEDLHARGPVQWPRTDK